MKKGQNLINNLKANMRVKMKIASWMWNIKNKKKEERIIKIIKYHICNLKLDGNIT